MIEISGVGIVKNKCGQSFDRALKLAVSERWTDGISCFLHVDTDSQKLKADPKWVWPVRSQNSKIDCILQMNVWNKLICLHAVTNLGKLNIDSIIFG